MKYIVGVLGIVLVIAIVFGSWLFWKMDVVKGEIGLAQRYEAQQNTVETSLFKMRSAIQNIHKCTTEWADKFIAVVAQQAAGRSSNGKASGTTTVDPKTVAAGAAMSGGLGVNVSRESEALGIPQELYLKLANAIEGQLADFTRQQDTLTDVWREHSTYCKDPYHNWLGVSLADKVMPKPEMISSGATKEAIKTKKMDENLL
jgi:hypothetical protein